MNFYLEISSVILLSCFLETFDHFPLVGNEEKRFTQGPQQLF